MIGIIVQARLGSSRLPNKMILPFYKNKGILELLIEKLANNFHDLPIIIATSTSKIDDTIFDLADRKNIKCFRGSENNVLDRFYKAGKFFNLTKIIRICADNPFLNVLELKKIVNEFENSNHDYLSFQTADKTPIIKTHYGLWAEGVTLDALYRVKTNDLHYLEHVTNYIYEHPNEFIIKFLDIEKENNLIRLTTDTKEDFILNKEIFVDLKRNNFTNVYELLDYISNKKDWIIRMEEQINKNIK